MGVVKLPFRDRSARNSRSIQPRISLQLFQRHIAAVRPAIDGDLIGVDKVEGFEKLSAHFLVAHFNPAHCAV